MCVSRSLAGRLLARILECFSLSYSWYTRGRDGTWKIGVVFPQTPASPDSCELSFCSLNLEIYILVLYYTKKLETKCTGELNSAKFFFQQTFGKVKPVEYLTHFEGTYYPIINFKVKFHSAPLNSLNKIENIHCSIQCRSLQL